MGILIPIEYIERNTRLKEPIIIDTYDGLPPKKWRSIASVNGNEIPCFDINTDELRMELFKAYIDMIEFEHTTSIPKFDEYKDIEFIDTIKDILGERNLFRLIRIISNCEMRLNKSCESLNCEECIKSRLIPFNC